MLLGTDSRLLLHQTCVKMIKPVFGGFSRTICMACRCSYFVCRHLLLSPLAYRRYVDSSFGWDPTSKRRELFDSASRFVLVRQIGPPESVESQPISKPLIAYTMFRFDREARENVVYWYVSLVFDGS
jgi:hypothetical protein